MADNLTSYLGRGVGWREVIRIPQEMTNSRRASSRFPTCILTVFPATGRDSSTTGTAITSSRLKRLFLAMQPTKRSVHKMCPQQVAAVHAPKRYTRVTVRVIGISLVISIHFSARLRREDGTTSST